MGKRRYHYDRKGNLRGSSSNSFLAGPSTYRMLLIIALGALGWHALTDKKENAEGDRALTREVSGIEELIAATPPVASETTSRSAGPIPEVVASPKELPLTISDVGERASRSPSRSASNDETEIQGAVSSRCPADIIEYYQQQCEAGDEQACTLAKCE